MRLISFTVAALALITSCLTMASASEKNSVGFSVSPVLPENSNPTSAGFFDLTVAPGDRQELLFSINNDSPEEIVVRASLYTVTTNLNGIVDYSAPGRSDETLMHNMADIASLSQEHIIIPAGKLSEVTVSLTVPEESFDGILLGAIRTIREPTQRELAESGMIVNRFSYIIPIRLRQTDCLIETNFLLGDLSALLVNSMASIVVDIRNPMPKLVRGVETSAKIYISGIETPLYESSGFIADFAPNSVLPFTLKNTPGSGIQAGHYTARINLAHEGTNWEFEHTFEITPEIAASVNSGVVNLIQNSMQNQSGNGDLGDISLWVIIVSAAFVILVIVLAVVVVLKYNNAIKIATGGS